MATSRRLGVLVGLALLIRGGFAPVACGAEPVIVETITEIETHYQFSEPPNLVVTASGEVPTAGYTNTRLLRVVYVQPPPDGIQDYFLMSTPPDNPAGQMISTVTASDTYPQVTVAAPWLKGVRVHGVGDGTRTHYFDAPLRVRKNILELTEAELDAIRAGIAEMKARPANDPTSWRFQANMHWSPFGTPSNPLFNQCEHGTIQFLTWHRGYIYHFERILRKASGNNALTLPYWDWSTAPALPLAFRDPDSTLFDASRSINNGALLPSEVVVDDLQSAMNQIPFRPGFSSQLEGSPHGAVHVLIGGNMSSVPTAARDPIFWLHHGNIDRLWDAWLNRNAGRMNPSSSSFLNQSYTFVDENGDPVTVTVADIISSQTLGYRYDDVPNPTLLPMPPERLAEAGRLMNVSAPRNGTAENDAGLVASSVAAGQATVAAPTRQSLGLEAKRVELDFSEGGAERFHGAVADLRSGDRTVIVEVRGLSLKAPPSFTYAAYLNLPEGDVPEETRRLHRIGTLDLFSLTARHEEQHAHDDHPTDDEGEKENTGHGDNEHAARHPVDRLDATATVARLKAAGRWDGSAVSITLLPVTPIAPPGQEEATRTALRQSAEKADVSYQRIDLRIVESGK